MMKHKAFGLGLLALMSTVGGIGVANAMADANISTQAYTGTFTALNVPTGGDPGPVISCTSKGGIGRISSCSSYDRTRSGSKISYSYAMEVDYQTPVTQAAFSIAFLDIYGLAQGCVFTGTVNGNTITFTTSEAVGGATCTIVGKPTVSLYARSFPGFQMEMK